MHVCFNVCKCMSIYVCVCKCVLIYVCIIYIYVINRQIKIVFGGERNR